MSSPHVKAPNTEQKSLIVEVSSAASEEKWWVKPAQLKVELQDAEGHQI